MSTEVPNSAILIGVISSSRSLDKDEGGAALMACLEKAGFRVVDRVEVGEAPQEIRRFMVAAQDRRDVGALVLVGGTGLAAMDHVHETVRDFIDKGLPGFGEALRALLANQFRSRSFRFRASAGVLGVLPVFSLPGEPAVCKAAAEQLIAPELAAILKEIHREPPPEESISKTVPLEAQDPPAEDESESPDSDPQDGSESVDSDSDTESPPEGWQKQLLELGGQLDLESHPELPDWLAGLAAATEVLNTSGERGLVELKQGSYVAFGFPDLRGARSRVILLGQRSPRDEILALHRWPLPTGICAPRVGGVIAHRGRMGRTAEEVTGVDYPGDGRLFAVGAGKVFVLEGANVQAWDGKNSKSLGPEVSALASLLLRWSQH